MICKHCQTPIVECVDYRPRSADICNGYVHDVESGQDHYCVINGVQTENLAQLDRTKAVDNGS